MVVVAYVWNVTNALQTFLHIILVKYFILLSCMRTSIVPSKWIDLYIQTNKQKKKD